MPSVKLTGNPQEKKGGNKLESPVHWSQVVVHMHGLHIFITGSPHPSLTIVLSLPAWFTLEGLYTSNIQMDSLSNSSAISFIAKCFSFNYSKIQFLSTLTIFYLFKGV